MRMNYVLGRPTFSNEDDAEPVLLNEMKQYLIISSSETYFDDLITSLITTAREQLEDYLNRSLIGRTVTARLQNDAGYMQLPFSAPVLVITSVTDDSSNVITSDNYSLKGTTFSSGNSYTLSDTFGPWPQDYLFNTCLDSCCQDSANIVNVTYTAAYDDSGLPKKFKTAIMQQVAWLYERKGDEITSALSPLVKVSLKPYRLVV